MDLITQFLSIALEIPVEIKVYDTPTDEMKFTRKQMAIKILTLKVLSFLKWNLDKIEKYLPIRRQVQLLSDLCSITVGNVVNLPIFLDDGAVNDGSCVTPQVKFALTLCHLWIIRLPIARVGRNNKVPNVIM